MSRVVLPALLVALAWSLSGCLDDLPAPIDCFDATGEAPACVPERSMCVAGRPCDQAQECGAPATPCPPELDLPPSARCARLKPPAPAEGSCICGDVACAVACDGQGIVLVRVAGDAPATELTAFTMNEGSAVSGIARIHVRARGALSLGALLQIGQEAPLLFTGNVEGGEQLTFFELPPPPSGAPTVTLSGNQTRLTVGTPAGESSIGELDCIVLVVETPGS